LTAALDLRYWLTEALWRGNYVGHGSRGGLALRRTEMKRHFLCILCILAVVAIAAPAHGATTPTRASSISPRLREATVLEPENPKTQHRVVVGLDLRNRGELESLLADMQNPNSPRYRRFLTPEEFNSRYAPSADTEQGVVDYLQANGLSVTRRFPNRLLVAAVGSVGALNRAFGVELRRVSFRGTPHFATINEPSLPDDIAGHVVGVIGLDNLSVRQPHLRRIQPAAAPPVGSGLPCCSFSPKDLKAFYDNGGSYDGSRQTVVIAGAYQWSPSDVEGFNTQWGLTSLPAKSDQVCTGAYPETDPGCQIDFGSADQSSEITFDVEYAHGTAPGATIINYMAASTSSGDFMTMYEQIVTDNPGHIVTTSWGSCEAGSSAAEQLADDSIFANANALGQTWFAASGDNGSWDCGDRRLTVDHPANSPHVIGVGGTAATCEGGMTPACKGYGSESGWSDSGGGISQVFARPQFQAGCGVPAGTQRLVPDVALEADPSSPGNFVYENGTWYIYGGTSGGGPQWAGIFAELNEQLGGAGLGNAGAGLYSICATAFHDITTGSNGDYSAAPGYDMVTGLGSPYVTTLLGSFPTIAPPGTPTATPTPTPTPPPDLIPGSGQAASDCTLEWSTDPVPPAGRNGLPANRLDLTATAGDTPCTFYVAMCFNVDDDRLPACTPTDVARVQILSPSAIPATKTNLANRAALEGAVTNLGASVGGLCRNRARQGQLCSANADCDSTPGSGNGICRGDFLVFSPPLASHNVCTSFATITVPLHSLKRLSLKAVRSEGGTDTDWLTLVCHPPA